MTFDKKPGYAAVHEANTVLNASLATIAQLLVNDVSFVGIEVKSETDGTYQDALDQFEVQAQFHRDGPWITLYSAAADFTSPAGLVVAASGDLTTLAYQATGWLLLNVLPLYSVRFQAASAMAGNGSKITVRGGGKA